MAFRRPRRDDRAPEPEPAPSDADSEAEPDDDLEGVSLDDHEHSWWAQREQLASGVPQGRRRRREEPKPDLDDQWSIDKLFDFVPGYELDVDNVDRPDEETTFDADELFRDPDAERRAEQRAESLFRADDPYAVLGVPSTASWDEITDAHRRLARLHHPDRLTGATDEAKERSEERMREVNIAYSELRRRRAR